MAFAILRITKQKGGSVGASGHHNDRTRETPNADPEKETQNRLLLGEDRNVRELVAECIEEHGGKPRRDSVEAVEYLLTASPEFFIEGDPRMLEEKIDRFCERALAFLSDPRSGGPTVKAVLHLDERTPHIHAHKVPIDPQGKLNAKYFYGTRARLGRLQDVYHEYMAPLGLERGVEGSRARHQEVKKFYAAITRDPQFKVDRSRLPDPPRVMLTQEARDQYKAEVAKGVMGQLDEDLRVLRHQAMLARDEHNQRVEIERRAGERVAEVERRAEMAEARLEPLTAEMERLRQANDFLNRRDVEAGRALAEQREKTRILGLRNRELAARLEDIPMPEVMDRLGYEGERRADRTVYRDEEDQVSMYIITAENRAYDVEQNLRAASSIDLVVFMRTEVEGGECDRRQAFVWLADTFGAGRAAGAYLCEREREFFTFLAQQRGERQRGRSPLTPDRDQARPEHDHDHERGGDGYSFGR